MQIPVSSRNETPHGGLKHGRYALESSMYNELEILDEV